MHIQVNLDALIGRLQHNLQATINLVALSMRGDVGEDDGEIELPLGQGMHINLAAQLRWTREQRLEYRDRWLITNGLRDCIEHVGIFLDEAREILAVWRLLDTRINDRVRMDDFRNIGVAQGLFINRNLPDKVDAFALEFGIQIDEALIDQILSINRARNCYVHRRGVVTAKDLKGDLALIVRWRSMQPKYRGADGIEVALPFGVMVGPGEVFLRVEDREKQFALGASLEFSLREFSEMSWGIFLFGRALVDAIIGSGTARGYVQPPAAPAEPPAPRVDSGVETPPSPGENIR